jgi:hypothetical protein
MSADDVDGDLSGTKGWNEDGVPGIPDLGSLLHWVASPQECGKSLTDDVITSLRGHMC